MIKDPTRESNTLDLLYSAMSQLLSLLRSKKLVISDHNIIHQGSCAVLQSLTFIFEK